MSSHRYTSSEQPLPSYQLDSASYQSLEQPVNSSQNHPFNSYETHSQSPTISYDVPSRGYGSHLTPSNPSSPVVSHRPTPSPGIPNSFVLPSHLETISPTAIYQHQSDSHLPQPQHARSRSHSNPHSHSRSHSLSQPREFQMSVMASPVSSAFPSYDSHSSSFHSQQQLEQDFGLPDPHASRPQLSISVSGSLVGHPEGWNDNSGMTSTISEALPTNPTPSPRSRTVALGGKKKKASPRTTTVPLPARKRSPASCAPCRKKKLKCDRSLPCSSCIAKGTECVWEGDATPLYIKDEHELHGTKELQAQVDRLQAIVDELASSPKSNKTSLRLDSMTASEEASVDSSPTFELLAHDLPQGLVEVALDGIFPPQQVGELAMSPTSHDSSSFVEDARLYCRSRQQPSLPLASSLITPSASSSEVSPSSSFFPPARTSVVSPSQFLQTRPDFSLLKSIPSSLDLDKASNHFFNSVNLLVPLFDRAKVKQWSETMQQRNEESADFNPGSVALVVAVSAAGLAKMTEQEALGLVTVEDRPTTLRRWIEVATSALSLSQFPEAPTYDGIRTALAIAWILLVSHQELEASSYPSAMSLLSSAVQASFTLELNREPNRNGRTKYRFSECQERRRLFWSVFSICSAVTTDTSRLWPQLDLRYIDTHFPLDCFDDELAMDELAIRASVRARVNSETFEETPMTFNLSMARLAFVAKKISEEASIIGGCRYSKISRFTAELRHLEKSLPPCYRIQFDNDERPFFAPRSSFSTSLKAALIQVSISSEIVRLNRPFLVLAATDEKYQGSRERAVLHAKRVLSIAIEPQCKPIAAELSLKVLSAAVVLGIELLQSPDEADAEILRSLIGAASELLERHSKSSLVASRALHVLGFLLEQIETSRSSSSSRKYRAKRPRTNQHSPDEKNFQLRQSWLHSIPNSTYPSRAGSPDSDSEVFVLRRKSNRPALKHSARSESHLSNRARFAPRPPPLSRTHRSHSAEDFPSFEGFPVPPSPAATSTSAPSVAALSPVINFDNSQQPPRSRTFSDPASSHHLSNISELAQSPAHSMFRYYQHHSITNRATYGTTLDTGLGLVDFAHHGRPLGSSIPFDDSVPTSFYNNQPEERMETEDIRGFENNSSTIEDFSFAPNYRHS
ncbi:hypothetical protein JCM3765_005477 [Sporobolomyces pararoseus]